MLAVHGMDKLTTDRANVHTFVLCDVLPVPSLCREFKSVALGVLVQFIAVGPDAGLYPFGIFCAHGDRNDRYLITKGDPGGLFLLLVLMLMFLYRSVVVCVDGVGRSLSLLLGGFLRHERSQK